MVPYEPCSVCSGLVDPSELLANIEEQIVKSKEEAVGRKEIMDRIDRWLSACEEENWLEDYNQVSWNIVVWVFPCAWFGKELRLGIWMISFLPLIVVFFILHILLLFLDLAYKLISSLKWTDVIYKQ